MSCQSSEVSFQVSTCLFMLCGAPEQCIYMQFSLSNKDWVLLGGPDFVTALQGRVLAQP